MTVERAHVILYVRDQGASREFYATVLGVAPSLDVPGMTEIPLTGGAVLGLMPEANIVKLLGPAVAPTEPRGTGRAELYLLVADPEAHHARALAAGAKELSPVVPRNWGHRAGYCLDPDGHVLAFAEELA